MSLSRRNVFVEAERRLEPSRSTDILPLLMTTWHEDETLASALWFALNVATPSEDWAHEPRSPAFVAVAASEYRDEVRQLVLDRERLDRESDDEPMA
jgi:hypothetical protein